jgi:hypothetical protein
MNVVIFVIQIKLPMLYISIMQNDKMASWKADEMEN